MNANGYDIVPHADLTNAYLAGCECPRVDALGAIFKGADLRGSSWRGSRLAGATFDGADLRNACFDDADLTDVTMRGAQLAGASFRRTLLPNADMRFIRWGDKDAMPSFLGADMHSVTLSGVRLRANFSEANLKRADFRWSDIRQSLLREASLGEATFAHADMQGCDLTRANLQRTDFSDASLLGAILHAATLDQSIILRTSTLRFFGETSWYPAFCVVRHSSTHMVALGSLWITLPEFKEHYASDPLLGSIIERIQEEWGQSHVDQ